MKHSLPFEFSPMALGVRAWSLERRPHESPGKWYSYRDTCNACSIDSPGRNCRGRLKKIVRRTYVARSTFHWAVRTPMAARVLQHTMITNRTNPVRGYQ